MDVDFTDDEIREELARLGYKDVPDDKFAEFKTDLMRLIHCERSKASSLNNSTDKSRSEVTSYTHAPAVSSKFVEGNLGSHGNQWLRSNYKEDWHYEGERRTARRAKSEIATSSVLHNVPTQAAAIRGEFSHSNHQSCPSEVCSESDSDLATKYMKRKTSRKSKSGHRVVDESFSTSDSIDSSGLFEIYEKVKNLAMRDCECGKTRPTSADTEPPYRIKGVNRQPSVLLSRKEPPHTRNLVRMKPFQRHQMYQRAWKLQPAIGEDSRQNVCREVHNKMLKKDEVKLSQKIFVPNTYMVPSEKPRYELRWAVRKCNQNYEMPPCGFFHEV